MPAAKWICQKTGEYDEPFGQYRQADKRVKDIGQTVLKKELLLRQIWTL